MVVIVRVLFSLSLSLLLNYNSFSLPADDELSKVECAPVGWLVGVRFLATLSFTYIPQKMIY